MARTLQHRQAALIASIQTARTLDFYAPAATSRGEVSYAGVSIALVQKSRQARTAPSYRVVNNIRSSFFDDPNHVTGDKTK
jgi:hypothetical protein